MICINENKHRVSTCPLKKSSCNHQNDMKTSPALVTARLLISASILNSFEPHYGRKSLTKTEFWEPLNRDNAGDIILGLQN